MDSVPLVSANLETGISSFFCEHRIDEELLPCIGDKKGGVADQLYIHENISFILGSGLFYT